MRASSMPSSPASTRRLKCGTFVAPQIVSRPSAASGSATSAAGLERDAGVAADLDLDLDDPVGPRERRVDVAVAARERDDLVAGAVERRGVALDRARRRRGRRRAARAPGRRAPPRPRRRRGRRPRRPRRARRRSARRRRRGRAGGRRRAARRTARGGPGSAAPRSRSAAVSTAWTPGAARAAAVSTPTSRACADVARTTRIQTWPGRSTSSTNRPVPRQQAARPRRAGPTGRPPSWRGRLRRAVRGGADGLEDRSGSPCSGRGSTPSPRGSPSSVGSGLSAQQRGRRA